jgi:hypothetical protein
VNYWVQTWKKDGTAEQVVAAHAALEAAAAAMGKKASKAKAPATPAAKLKYGEDGYREPYSGAYKEAGHLVRSGIFPTEAARKVSDQFGVEFSAKSATRAQATTGLSPPKRGPETKYPREGEKVILQLIQEMRALKLPTYSHSVMNIAARLIARERGFVVVLRIPHTSHIAQGEDVIHFFKFKHEERVQKANVFNAKFTDLAVKNKNLGYEDLMTCIKDPWEHAFAEDQCKKAWEVIGVSPFTQSVYWNLNKRQMRMAKKTGSFVTHLHCPSSRIHMLPFVCRGC